MASSSTGTATGSVPEWLDPDRFPFEPNYRRFAPGRLHYVDEGEGRPLLMLHGNPTWSFLYRHLIDGLSDEYRCVAPDYYGFGRSATPVGWPARPVDHARVVESFADALDLEDVTLVVHDWGGPIGMEYATTHPENVRGLVVTNTFMWPLSSPTARAFSGVLGSRLGRLLVRRYNLFARVVMPAFFGDRSTFSPEIHRHYTAPLATPDDREGSWVFPRDLTGSDGWLADLHSRRDRVAGTPALLAWGLQDPGLGPLLGRWRELFPDAETVTFEDAGHYVPEEVGAELVPPVRAFLERT